MIQMHSLHVSPADLETGLAAMLAVMMDIYIETVPRLRLSHVTGWE